MKVIVKELGKTMKLNGNTVAECKDYTNKKGESDPMIDYGKGYFIHMSTLRQMQKSVFNEETGEELC